MCLTSHRLFFLLIEVATIAYRVQSNILATIVEGEALLISEFWDPCTANKISDFSYFTLDKMKVM